MTSGPLPDYDLVIFDNDGVLIDSEPLALGLFVAMMGEIGWHLTADEAVERFMGCSVPQVADMARERGFDVPRGFTRAFNERFLQSYRLGLQPTPGVTDVLDSITTDYCVASSAPKQHIALGLGLTGLLQRFEGRIFSGDDAPEGKPSPELFLLAARTRGVEPARCVVIDDSPYGIEAGNRAGMITIGFATLVPVDRLAAASAGVVRSMYQLLSVLR